MLKETKYFKEQHRQLSADVSGNLKMRHWTQKKKISRNVTIDFMRSGIFQPPLYNLGMVILQILLKFTFP